MDISKTHDLKVEKCPGCRREVRYWKPKVGIPSVAAHRPLVFHEAPLCWLWSAATGHVAFTAPGAESA